MRKIVVFSIILVLSNLFTFFLLPRIISNKNTSHKSSTTKTQIGTVIEAKTGSFNADGKTDTIQLRLLFNNQLFKSIRKNAKLVLIQDGKETDSKNVTLEDNSGELALVRLFDNSKQQILFTTGVGPHSMYGFFYQVKNNSLTPICPDDNHGDKKQGSDCSFFSDASSIYAQDLDGDGVDEIIASGHPYYDSQSPDKIYQWDGLEYKTVKGAQYDKFLATLNVLKR